MSIAQVAEKAGVSQATVSYVINNKPVVSAATVAKVRQAIKELGYRPRPSRSRSSSPPPSLQSNSIGLAIPDGVMSSSLLNTRLFEAIHKELEKRSLSLVPMRIARGTNLQETIVNNKTFSSLDGILLFYYTSLLDISSALSIPSVGILGHPDPTQPLICDHVEPDNIRVGALAAKYLVDKGHEHLAVINPATLPHAALDIRSQQFVMTATALKAKAKCHPIAIPMQAQTENMITAPPPQPKLTQWLSKYKKMKNPPTGLFIPSDAHLAIVYHSCRQAGLEPGKDLDFIGCNNDSSILHAMPPPPATIDINPDLLAQTAIDVLLLRIADADIKERRSFTTTYVEPGLITFEN